MRFTDSVDPPSVRTSCLNSREGGGGVYIVTIIHAQSCLSSVRELWGGCFLLVVRFLSGSAFQIMLLLRSGKLLKLSKTALNA